ncbi:MAG TPA: GIY-YIG nuclease family protein [Ignavibacteria bacterium]|nr:GIY-YIG nuclease family protein [Ignavibacteria bacterium]
MRSYYVYILANKRNGTLYIGVTNNLLQRVEQHKKKLIDGFSKKYGIDKLVYYEETNSVLAAIEREKQMKTWQRKWKIELIESINLGWKDLYYELGGI